ncbi:MAG TPA: hypothetical protein VFL66_06355 [Gaiellaceae bacterium]|nr:hypothetical protein [Gaiellaceae bacterium]
MRLRDEEGFALVTAVVLSAALLVAATTVLQLTASSGRSAAYSTAKGTAYQLADAGVGQALGILSKPSNNALDPTLLPRSTTVRYRGGTVTWGATLDQTKSTWTIVATGAVANPTGPHTGAALRTIRATVHINPTVTQPLNNPAWNYVYTTRAPSSGCDETIQQSVTIASPLFVSGNLCLQNSASVVAGPLVVKGYLDLQQKFNSVGSPTRYISDAHIGNGCRYQSSGAFDRPCKGAADHVYANVLDTNPTTVTAPTVYWDAWYRNASPGPYFPCTQVSGVPPTFDTTPPNGRNGTYNAAPFNLTPTAPYTCKTAAGELSWDPVQHLLTVSGTIFIDGSVYISNGAVNQYNGQATLYLSGTFLMKNAKLCAGLSADKSTCDVSTWNPNSELLCVVANGNGGQVNSWDSIQITSAFFQGALFATHSIDTDTTSSVDGPMVGDQINLGQSVSTSFPTIIQVPVGMPSNPTVYAQPDPPVYYG